ncbi:MAG: PfkB family carbohydrate kinase, partial [Pseudomonadales bacterium]
ATVYHAIEFANAAHIPVILNPAPATPKLNIDYACRCDYFIPNETELAILTNRPVDSIEAIKSAASDLMERGLQHLIVTLGAQGALHLHGASAGPHASAGLHASADLYQAPTVKAVDTTGAGDAFIGALAESLIRDLPLTSAIPRAIRYASHSVTRRGTQTAYATASAFDAWQSS